MRPAESAAPALPASNATSLLVRFKDGSAEQSIAALNGAHGTKQRKEIAGLHLRELQLPPGASAQKVAAAYRRSSLVAFAEPNELVTPGVIPNDPSYGSAWHLTKLEAAAAWDTSRATNVLTAVCDSGFEATHPDHEPVLRADLGWNTASDNGDWSPVMNHGTLVSGALAAATNNGAGVAGIAWGASIIPVRISNLADGSAYVSDAVECIQYAADRGARVINLSYRMAHSSAIDAAAAYARQRGALTFVAAGNDGAAQAWTDFPNFVSVAATTSMDVRASYSNTGAYVDIAAPGSNIQTTRTGGTYGPASGTSLASPVAAGVAALVFGANPGLSPSQVEAILRQSADDLGSAGEDNEYGAGRVNARRAVQLAGGGPAPTPGPTSSPSPTATPSPSVTTTPPPTATPTSTPTPGPGPRTESFAGKLGGKSPNSKSHPFSTASSGSVVVTLIWGGKAKLEYTVFDASGASILSASANGGTATASTLPPGAYRIEVRATSGQASYTANVTHH